MDARKRFLATLGVFLVWVAALTTLAAATGRRPVVKAPAVPAPTTAPAGR